MPFFKRNKQSLYFSPNFPKFQPSKVRTLEEEAKHLGEQLEVMPGKLEAEHQRVLMEREREIRQTVTAEVRDTVLWMQHVRMARLKTFEEVRVTISLGRYLINRTQDTRCYAEAIFVA